MAASEVIKGKWSYLAKRASSRASTNGGNLGFEATLWLAADKLRNKELAAVCQIRPWGTLLRQSGCSR